MPAITAPATVLVTGASGFIAAWVIKALLGKGYSVVGTVRSVSKGDYLKDIFKDYGPSFSYVIVEDISKLAAFNHVLDGIDAVEHIASPITFQVADPQELIRPAVDGTVGILQSIQKHGTSVKRTVITSSFASVVHVEIGPHIIFTEDDWNTDAPKEVEEKGRDTPGQIRYRASKVLDERAAWHSFETQKLNIHFDLVTICPPMVMGPILQDVASPSALNASIGFFYQITRKKYPPATEVEQLSAGRGLVDVRDLALAHVLALEKSEAGGQQFLAAAYGLCWQDMIDAIHASGDYLDVPTGFPRKGKDVKHATLSNAKIQRVPGLRFGPLAETSIDTLQSLRDRNVS